MSVPRVAIDVNKILHPREKNHLLSNGVSSRRGWQEEARLKSLGSQIPAVLLPNCVALDKSLPFSEPQFPQIDVRIKTSTLGRG